MFARALLAFLACPGTVAIVIPFIWLAVTSGRQLAHPLGLVPLALGFVALLWCVRDFYVAGKGPLPRGIHPGVLWLSACIDLSATRCTCPS